MKEKNTIEEKAENLKSKSTSVNKTKEDLNENDNTLTSQTLNQKEKELKNKVDRKKRLLKLFFTLGLLGLILLIVYLPLKLTGSLDKISSVEQIKEMILSTGIWGYLTFFIIQFVQVTFIPIPAIITTLAGVMVFGPWHALWISLLSVILASIFAFWLGRKFGTKLINWIIGEKEAEKYNKTLEKGKYVFFLMMLFPGFPDDILCMIAGMTNMSFKFFLTTNLITRPIAFITIIFIGSGRIIPFYGWGIYVWILLALLMGLAFYFSVKKQKQIEDFLLKISNKLKKKESDLKNKKIANTNKEKHEKKHKDFTEKN